MGSVALKAYPNIKDRGVAFFLDMGWSTDIIAAGFIWVPLSVICFLSIIVVANRVWYDVVQPIVRARYRRKCRSADDAGPLNIWISGQLAYPVTKLLRDEQEINAYIHAVKRWKNRSETIEKYMNKVKNQKRELVVGEAISIKRYLGESDDGVVPD